MSKRDYIIRYLLIIKKLRNSKLASFSEINDQIAREFEWFDSSRHISLRTFQRDINEIRTIFNIDIQCNSSGLYFIAEDENFGFNNRMIEAFDVFNSLSTSQQAIPFILLEKKCSVGSEHISEILSAIRNGHILKIEYKKFDDGNISSRFLEPYALKEFKGRWYLLSLDQDDSTIKTFALDRICALETSMNKYAYPNDFIPADHFKNCFGIIAPGIGNVEEIILSFEPYQGKYIKSYPLHETQEILIDNQKELRIKLHIFQTQDFIMELLSFGETVRVIQPGSLIATIHGIAKNMNTLYKRNTFN
jgi:predicted DNA-binding transcriptional regulator YafY